VRTLQNISCSTRLAIRWRSDLLGHLERECRTGIKEPAEHRARDSAHGRERCRLGEVFPYITAEDREHPEHLAGGDVAQRDLPSRLGVSENPHASFLKDVDGARVGRRCKDHLARGVCAEAGLALEPLALLTREPA